MIDYREDNKSTVYIHIIPKEVSGHQFDKYYVGITTKKPTVRWNSGKGYDYNQHFMNAINKYGWNNIEHHIVATHLTHDEACSMEKVLIKKLNSKNPLYGYNKTDGGDGGFGCIPNKETRKKMSEAKIGSKNHFYGKHHTEEIRKIMSEKHRDCSGGNNPSAKKVYQFDLKYNYIQNFACATDAERYLGISDNIANRIQHRKPFAGYIWAHEEDIVIDDMGNISLPIQYNISYTNKKVYLFSKEYEFIKEYNSLIEAVNKRYNKKYTGLIRECAKNRSQLKNGDIWRFAYDVKESEDNSGSFILLR